MAAETFAPPRVHSRPKDARAWVDRQIAEGRSVALVPTMGALHKGHLELVRQARAVADCVAASIFVNPAQFGPSEDYQRYPRTFHEDLQLLRQEGVAMVFAPTGPDMYGERFSTYVTPPAVAQPLEGSFRPGHFRGVCTVVLKLFHIIPAHVAVFGQKDYQQVRVIADMIDDLDLDITLKLVPTVRDPDGLAMSSRNRYLSPQDRSRALGLSKALASAADCFRQGERDAAKLQAVMKDALQRAEVDRIDYAAVVDPVTLLPFERAIAVPPRATDDADAAPAAVALIAAHVGGTRLIDNRLLGAEAAS